MTVLQQVLTWSASAPAWLQDALRRIVSGAELTNDLAIAELANLCKVPHGLGTAVAEPVPLSAEDIPVHIDEGSVTLSAITHLSDVNALAPNEILSFAAAGLTVIYGDNGAGKSSFSRILRRTCRARGADDPILANALSDTPAGAPTARIDYQVAGAPRTQTWKDGTVAAAELSAVSVFDTASAQVHVEDKTDVRFRPFGLDVVDRAASTCMHVKKVLEVEVNTLRTHPIKLPAIPTTTEAGRLLATLSALTPRNEVERLGTLTAEEQREFESLSGILATAKAEDPAKKSQDLRLKVARLRRLADELRTLSETLSQARVENLATLASEAESAQATASRLEEAFARQVSLPGAGSPEWAAMWEAAKGYSVARAYMGEAFPHVDDGALCVLCQQELAGSAQLRMQQLAGLAVNEARTTARHTKEAAEKARRAVAALQPGEQNKDAIADLRTIDVKVAEEVDAFLVAARTCRDRIADSAVEATACAAIPPLWELEALAGELASRAEGLMRAADPTDRARSEERMTELTARRTLGSSLAEVLGEIERRAKINAYDQCIKDTDTRALTKLGGDLTRRHVTDALAAAFDAELKRLGFTALELELKPATAQRGQLFHKIQLKHATLAALPRVVSEGESRCIALAAFMAELEATNHASTMVLRYDQKLCFGLS